MLEDTMIAAAIGALAGIFLSAFIGLLLIICRRLQKKHPTTDWQRFDSTKRNHKKQSTEFTTEEETAIQLGDFGGLGNALDQIIHDEKWLNDASGLIPHCLNILRICLTLTENVTTLIMSPIHKNSSELLINTAKRIPIYVDRVVVAMYPPIDPRFLEVKAKDLVKNILKLVLIAQSLTPNKTNAIWWSLNDNQRKLNSHLRYLRRAARRFEDETKHNECASQSVYV